MKISKNNYLWYTALLVWAVFSIAILIYAAIIQSRSVYPLYFNVGNAWNAGRDLYTGDCTAYMYWPGFSVIFSVLARLPFWLGSVAWSAINIGTIFLATFQLGRAVFSDEKNKVGTLLLLAFPLVFEGIVNQQSNAFIAALAILGAVSVYKNRLWLGAFLMLFAGVSKIAPIAFALLFVAVYPKELWWRYLLMLGAVLVVPFAFGGIEYGMQQHYSWINLLTSELNERWAYRDFWTVYELIANGVVSRNSIPEYPTWYRGLQLISAAVLCGVCMWQRYICKYNRKSMLVAVVMSGSVWWLLFGPSTEIATCVAGVGVAGLGTLLARDSKYGWWVMLPAYICVALGSSGDFEYNMNMVFHSDWTTGILPFGAILMYVWVCSCATRALALTTEDK